MAADYLKLIEESKTPQEAATYVRAFGASIAAKATYYVPEERVQLVEKAERHAEALERPWDCEGAESPWRLWLFDWGYVTGSLWEVVNADSGDTAACTACAKAMRGGELMDAAASLTGKPVDGSGRSCPSWYKKDGQSPDLCESRIFESERWSR